MRHISQQPQLVPASSLTCPNLHCPTTRSGRLRFLNHKHAKFLEREEKSFRRRKLLFPAANKIDKMMD
ncbi:hypothetical protein CEXT_793371 [Caerostris extrusa]|uniref:Uncharacterized protein n=1 Tax=Caerostris extrusa TaxID=172846 RepID=A0AAV4SWN9_CAEEX|nr:hypothetical protein CEXT_793371 [Caerostris extrusa]